MSGCWNHSYTAEWWYLCRNHLSSTQLWQLIHYFNIKTLQTGNTHSCHSVLSLVIKIVTCNSCNDVLKTFVISSGKGVCKTTTIWLRRRLKTYAHHVGLSTTEARCSDHSSCFLRRRLETLSINFIFINTSVSRHFSSGVYDAYIVTSEFFIFKLKYKNNLKSHICEPIFAFSLILK